MLIIGIDPGYEKMGCAVLEKLNGKENLLYSSCIITQKDDSHQKRLLIIEQQLEKIINKFKPDIMAIEKLFFTANQKTVIRVAEARGVALVAAAKHNMEVAELTPLEVKMALTGYGRAEKEQVKKMAVNILKLKKVPKSDDEIDAIAIAIACSVKLSGYN